MLEVMDYYSPLYQRQTASEPTYQPPPTVDYRVRARAIHIFTTSSSSSSPLYKYGPPVLFVLPPLSPRSISSSSSQIHHPPAIDRSPAVLVLSSFLVAGHELREQLFWSLSHFLSFFFLCFFVSSSPPPACADERSNGMRAGGRGGRRVEYGRTYVVRPKGRHQATIVWLHGLGDNGAR